METFRGDVDLSPALTVIRDHELVFYDRFLKDVANDWDERPPAELYVLGANEWRGEREWPLARATADGLPPPQRRRPVGRAGRRRTSRPTATTTTLRIPSRRSAASTRC